jgi:RNase adaptor protein for sRNA GlmZ degradation
MNLIFIYGPPAAGKLTVAGEIAALTGYKVFHNHLSIDCIEPVFEFGTPSFYKLIEKIRLDVISEAARENVSLIYTFCYAKDLDDAHIDKVLEAVEKHGGEVCFILLRCQREELEKRVVEESRRKYGKANNLNILNELLDKYELFQPVNARKSLIIDNTNLSPQETARRIAEHFNLL